MDTTTIEASIKPTSDSTTILSTADSSEVKQDKQPKKLVRVNKLVAVMMGFIVLVTLAVGYLAFINPFPIYVIPMRIFGMKIGYKFYVDPRNLVYFLYPKEGKVVQEADGTVVWKYADEEVDNAIAIIQPAKEGLPKDGCVALDETVWGCLEDTVDGPITSYYIRKDGPVYQVNFGTKKSREFNHAKVNDDIFFTRLLQSLLPSKTQPPVAGNVEFKGMKTRLPSGWSVTSLVLQLRVDYNMIRGYISIDKFPYSIMFAGDNENDLCQSDMFYDDTGALVEQHDIEVVIANDIYRPDIIGTVQKERYSRFKDKSKYEFSLCTDDVMRKGHVPVTKLGLASYTIPKNFDPKILDEMDGIIRDLAKNSNKAFPKPISITVVDTTSSWKTYKSEFYKFQFKYPSNWEISETGSYGKEIGGYTSLDLRAPRIQKASEKQIDPSDKYYSFLSFMPDFPKTGFSPIDGALDAGFIKALREEKIIAGKNSTVFNVEVVLSLDEPSMWGPNGSKYIFSYINMGDKFLQIEYSISDSYPEIYNQIMSTLSFF